MTYYSESLRSPVSADYVRSTYGVDPDTALHLGIYPLTEAPAGYTALFYNKQGERYVAVPSPISDAEAATVRKQHQLVTRPKWSADAVYQPGDLVQHQGKLYRKADDKDNTEPDAVPGGWIEE